MHPRAPHLKALAEKWAAVAPAERVTSQPFLIDLCDALGVARPDAGRGDYSFEYPVQTTDKKTGKTTPNRIDLYKRDHFILESKHVEGDRSAERVLGAAYGQAKGYAADIPHAPPPFLLVLNVGRTLLVWDRWGGNYGGVNAARRIDLARLWERDEEIDYLRAVWENPASLDPSVRGRQVTREVAERLAKLSASLEARGLESERVARFLIRCVFTMFAEDVELLQGKPFQTAIRDFREDPAEFAAAMTELWRAMDAGTRFGLKKLLRFNGHFFHDAEALPLDRADMAVLAEAAEADWRQVEPTIFGTLLTRALDPVERHRLGAEYTPREYVERVVRQTVDVPIRERWAPVQAEVLQLTGTGRRKDREAALGRLREFHAWLRGLRFLDPACGSGNFLYVTLNMVKRVELEVLRGIEEITGNPELGIEEVGPWQFHGIEVKRWAREIAELTLWIGFHQFWLEHHKGVNPPEPVLQDTGTLELRDAVLAWDEIVEIPEKSRLDPTPRIPHPVTGKLVPDPNARLPYYEYRGARQAPWPQADFIVGNPPYLGVRRQRSVFGDGYVNALRSVYPDFLTVADFVMYWWHRAAKAIETGQTIRAGLITTNSITQAFNRQTIEKAAQQGVRVIWAISDHPWVDELKGAAVRVAITVISAEESPVVLVAVDESAEVIGQAVHPSLNSDLTGGADIASATAVSLIANRGISFRGFTLVGRGFVMDSSEAMALGEEFLTTSLVRPYLSGRDLVQRPRGVYVIDFGLRSELEAQAYPVLYDLVRIRVKSERDANPRQVYRENWWRFAEPRPDFRNAVSDLSRYLATAYVTKHPTFSIMEVAIAPDETIVCIASDDSFLLGVLLSAIHQIWAVAAGSRLGVGNDPRYNASTCFDPFPFADPPPVIRAQIAARANQIDQHRKDALARDERVTITKTYLVFIIVDLLFIALIDRFVQTRKLMQPLRLLRTDHQEPRALRQPAPAFPSVGARVRAWRSQRTRPLLPGSKAWPSPLHAGPRSDRPSMKAMAASPPATGLERLPPTPVSEQSWARRSSRNAGSGTPAGASGRFPAFPPLPAHRGGPQAAPGSLRAPSATASRTPPPPAGPTHRANPSALRRRRFDEFPALAA